MGVGPEEFPFPSCRVDSPLIQSIFSVQVRANPIHDLKPHMDLALAGSGQARAFR